MSTPAQHRSPSPAFVVCAAVLLLALLAQTGFGRHALHGLGLYTPSEPVVALSFIDPSQVANDGVLVPTRPPRTVPVAFSVSNATPRAGVFAWRATVAGHTAASGRLRVASRRSATARPIVGPVCVGPRPPTRVRISVSLAQPARSINFWVVCRA